ncbi:aspartate dehydrogenase [Neorhizobium sp. NCHU2750]|uniref:aspartate dehydrogenase n=1 Tax=Neorhizobium sp. NCHU2750 TaxID=1825976 RepID=UPI000E71A415|nr:aspartate dehydrogenase [Neorhizobium sp. NCHU2750]
MAEQQQPTAKVHPRVGIVGMGAIGNGVARLLVQEAAGFVLTGVNGGKSLKNVEAIQVANRTIPVMGLDDLVACCDIIVDCAPATAFRAIAEASLGAGRQLVTVSGAALLSNMEVKEIARAAGGRIILATGALLGLDAVRAAAEGEIFSARLVTRKPPSSLEKAKFVIENRLDLSNLPKALKIFEGSAREAALAFPANVNVAAALALAGIGPERTMVEIWADPELERNTHRVAIEADSTRLDMTIENVPDPANPATGRITALSIYSALKSINAVMRIGS